MTFRKYLRYFLFIGTNWNYLLAFFTIRHEIRGERKYDLDTTELVDIHHLPVLGNNLHHASNYQAANYFLLEKAFSYLQSIQANASLLDFGCGKGRVMAVAAHFGFKQIKGVDFADELIRQAEHTLGPVKEKFPLVKF
ncbi:MAG: class I SAM-dependent methyltransferase, partial [Ginsengibacter sp.]